MLASFAFLGQPANPSAAPAQINPAGPPGPAGQPGAPGAQGPAGSNGASTIAALTDATAAFRALNALDPASQRLAMGAASASDLLGVAQDTLTALDGKLDTNGDASGATVTPTGLSAARKLADKIADQPITPRDFPALFSGQDATAAVQAAINAAIAQYPRAVDLSGTWNVSKIQVLGGNGLILTGVCHLIGNATGAQTCLLEIGMGGVNIDGANIKVNCNYNTLYDCAVWTYATSSATCQFSFHDHIQAVGAKLGFRYGRTDYPSALTSEITVTGTSTYGCPRVCEVVGVETFVTFIGPQWSADSFGGNTAWAALPKRGLTVIGAFANVTGGECIMTGDTGGFLIEVQPLAGANGEGTVWGRASFLNVFTETASPLARSYNPNGLTIGPAAGNRGLIMFSGCQGFHSQDAAAFIQAGADFDGDLIVKACRWWHPGSTRAQLDISCDGTLADVYVDEMGFGPGFQNTAAGISGGVMHFTKRQILAASGLRPGGTAQAFPAATSTVLLFQTLDLSNGLGRWSAYYNAATGVFTVPPGGLKNVEVCAGLLASGVTANLFVQISADGGSTWADQPYAYFSTVGQTVWYNPVLAAGTKIRVILGVFSGSGSASTNDNIHRFSISASA